MIVNREGGRVWIPDSEIRRIGEDGDGVHVSISDGGVIWVKDSFDDLVGQIGQVNVDLMASSFISKVAPELKSVVMLEVMKQLEKRGLG